MKPATGISKLTYAYGKPLNYRIDRRISILVRKGKQVCKSVKLVLLTGLFGYLTDTVCDGYCVKFRLEAGFIVILAGDV